MSTACLEPEGVMAKASNPTVKLPPDLHRMIKLVTHDRGEGITDYLDDLLRPLVSKDYAEFQRKIAAELRTGKRPSSKPHTDDN